MSTTTLNQENIIKKVYDPGTETLKVNAIATIAPGIVEITISDTDDSIKIGDGNGNYLNINPDGSINANLILNSDSIINYFNEIDSVASGVTSIILSHTALANTKLLSCDFGGNNIAQYYLYINGVLSAKRYTYWCNFNERIDFKDGLALNAGDLIEVEVLHGRPTLGSFNCNILIAS